MKTIIPENLPPKLPNDFWTKLGQDQALLIYKDAQNGIMQNGTQHHKYKSIAYMRYKSNNMRRLTKGAGKMFSDKEGYFYGKTYFRNKKAGYSYKNKRGTGDRIGNYGGRQIESNTTSWVDMILTGETFRALTSSPAALLNGEGVMISYNQADAGKVLGNQERGYDILGMRKENQDFTFKRILDEFDERLRKEWEDNITITIG